MTGGVLDSTDICTKRASGCYAGTIGAYIGQIVCLNPTSLSMVPGFTVVRANTTTV